VKNTHGTNISQDVPIESTVELHLAGQLLAVWNQPVRLSEGFIQAFASSQNHPNQAVHAS
jgi:hypothetical protein